MHNPPLHVMFCSSNSTILHLYLLKKLGNRDGWSWVLGKEHLKQVLFQDSLQIESFQNIVEGLLGTRSIGDRRWYVCFMVAVSCKLQLIK